MELELPAKGDEPDQIGLGAPLGRTNTVFPPVWISLQIAQPEPGQQVDVSSLVGAALEARTVVDISVHPALFGGHIRGSQYHDSSLLMSQGGLEIERCADEKGVSDLLQAHLIETLSAIGREHIDIYFLRVRTPLEEFQVEAALQTLEMARQEGHVRFVGLASEGKTVHPALGAWQFHDAFDLILLPDGHTGLESLAIERRVGIVAKRPFDSHPRLGTTLVPARSAEEIHSLSAVNHVQRAV